MSALQGKRILVVEDDQATGAALCDALRAAGAVALGPAPTVYYAMSLLGSRRVDAALLDIRLHRADVFPLVAHLQSRNVPMVLAAHAQSDVIPERHGELPVLTKPYTTQAALDALAGLVQGNREDKRAVPLPVGPGRDDDGYRVDRAVASAIRQ